MAIKKTYSPVIACQQGFATLVVALVILFLLTFMTLYAAKVGVIEQRTSANEFRAEEAFAAAESGIEQGIAYLKRNKKRINSDASGGWMNESSSLHWVACSSDDIARPCGDGTDNLYDNRWWFIDNAQDTGDTAQPVQGSYTLHFLMHTVMPAVFVVAEGNSADGSGQALVKQGVYFYPFIATSPDAPLMAAGTIGGSGTLDVVTNPNGGGIGVPLSAWASDDITLGGSAKTCQIDEFLSTDDNYTYQTDGMGHTLTLCPACTCPAAEVLSDSSTENIDILDADSDSGANPDTTDFPADMFEYIFGVPETDWQIVKDEATVLPDCSSLNAGSSGLYWITGSCNPSNNIGSYAAPVLLVVEGDVTVNSSLRIFALIFGFNSSPSTDTVAIHLNGGPTIYGAVISNKSIDFGNGTYRMRFDGTVLQNLHNAVGGRGLGKIPGSWADY